jgi:hypothetical protein
MREFQPEDTLAVGSITGLAKVCHAVIFLWFTGVVRPIYGLRISEFDER